MPQVLAISGLIVATLLYWMLVRRRSSVRLGIQSMSRALSASNEVALSRIRGGLRAPTPPASGDSGDWRDGIVVTDRRSGRDRRKWYDRRLGRGRRTGSDRRQSESSR
jgi:hypothetical protein